MGPDRPLPIETSFSSTDEYINSLINLLTVDKLLKTLCGGIHILDFLTATPDLYSQILSQEWRDFIQHYEALDILDLLIREDLEQFSSPQNESNERWRNGPPPPSSLLQYIHDVRRHLLNREPPTSQCNRNRAMKPTQKLARHVAVGMNVKKVHEVGLFSSYINGLTDDIRSSTGKQITHLVDFGSGQNYLGRALASQPYGKNVVAVESKHHNIEGARDFDIKARLTEKKKIMRNKKEFRAGLPQKNNGAEVVSNTSRTPPPETECRKCLPETETGKVEPRSESSKTTFQISSQGNGTVQYVEHRIQDGNLSDVVDQIVESSAVSRRDQSGCSDETNTDSSPSTTSTSFETTQITPSPNIQAHPSRALMTISLHSCGNLVYHGLRSLALNPSVVAVALVGCCYNLITERLVPSTYKLPELRPQAHPRLEKTGKACDPHGFPLSERFCAEHAKAGPGLNLNITARMMAVQAPSNWGEADCESFFTRHFYRAVLQRLLLDCGIIDAPNASDSLAQDGETRGGRVEKEVADGTSVSPAGHTSSIPIVIGSLPKGKYASFLLYARAALAKLYKDPDPELAQLFLWKTQGLTDERIERYEQVYAGKKKELAIVWSLMAFSAGVVEAAIVVDRWLWLKEQDFVQAAWVEPVFDYRLSPRNLVVVGVKN
ncbi:hypothetical protein K431DRAFT_330294 [Polychaeton citri CBS 116435]|uniref:Methyltransferase domain-containing protein n=1 Tax=Polychaeton citri CBS 116435 TaxID=1314669 RepID=A0A9P4UUI4_9PEZI|nr:hypothetical protein K431DRAFT_330294 [Polychaeton citri CBS 116435]